jgi:glutamine amidotransferase
MNRVAIVDYGLCNLDSVGRAIEECGGRPVVTANAADLEAADRIVLPGVGAFPDAMRNLRAAGLDEALSEQVLGQSVPFLGICLGMQLIAARGTEVEETSGLGWIDADVIRLVANGGNVRVPHVGWNEVVPTVPSPLFDRVPEGADFYFVHSYHVACRDPSLAAAITPYCGGFTSAVRRDHIFGLQFHPEKSQRHGFQVLRNFLAL